uniref:Uncharacterized protein n=1 Tax=Cannabis sativa TaxID=3483 RepID=A0A803QBV2_CANSA
MNPGEFWGGKHYINQDLLQLLYEGQPRLCTSPFSLSDGLSNLSFEDWEVSSESSPTPEPEVQHHFYSEQIAGEGYMQFIWELRKGWRHYLPSNWTYIVHPGVADTIPIGLPISGALGIPIAAPAVTIAWHTHQYPSRRRMMARTKQTMQKINVTDRHVARHATLSSAEQVLPATEEEDYEGGIEVQVVEDQDNDHLESPSKVEEE